MQRAAKRSALPPPGADDDAASAAATAAASSGGSSSPSPPASLDELTRQLDQAQEAYRRLQLHESDQQSQLQLAVHPGIPPRRVALAAGPPAAAAAAAGGPPALSAGAAYDSRRRELSSLTLELIMTLRMEQILRLRDSFEAHGGVVSVAQFVAIMAAQLDVRRLHTTPDMLLRSLVELFEAMDLDGDGELVSCSTQQTDAAASGRGGRTSEMGRVGPRRMLVRSAAAHRSCCVSAC